MTKTTSKFRPEVHERAVRRRLLDQETEYLIAEPQLAPKQQQLTPKAASEIQGTGLGSVLSETEGRARLKAIATTVAAEAGTRLFP